MKISSVQLKKIKGITSRFYGLCAVILLSAAPAFAQDEERITDAGTLLLGLIEGPFGALVMIVSGLVAIIAAAMGAYRSAMSCLVVAVGAFILRTIVAIFFPDSGIV